jgi:pyruvate dehydrogenase E2 component (dihydrolipoamide acetyltransferase)/2-oxoisovalerate dehydrogenase E2 component (dihydrolipoyl transacylase)
MDFALPPVGEGLIEVELVRWLVHPGDAVKRGQPLVEVMSDKATMEVPAPFAGRITTTVAEPNTKVKVGQLLLKYDADASVVTTPAPVGAMASGGRKPPVEPTSVPEFNRGLTPPARQANGTNGHHVAAAPSVRHLARKLGIDLGKVKGSGPAGRVLVEDLTTHLKPRAESAAPTKSAGTDVSKLDFGVAGTRVKLVGMRRKIAEHLVVSTRTIPHYAYIDECDLTDLVRLRQQLKDPFAKAGVKLTYLAFFVKAVARALKDVPVVNSTFDEPNQEVVLHPHYHVGVAVAAPSGLIVPVVKNVDKLDVAGIASEIERLSEDAKAGKSKLDDLKGGTFTVTSVGGIGGLISTPIINHPEVGIMGIGKVVKRPLYDSNGILRPTDVVYLSFSFDHRIVDGAVGASFGNAVIRYLQNPATLLIGEKVRS